MNLETKITIYKFTPQVFTLILFLGTEYTDFTEKNKENPRFPCIPCLKKIIKRLSASPLCL